MNLVHFCSTDVVSLTRPISPTQFTPINPPPVIRSDIRHRYFCLDDFSNSPLPGPVDRQSRHSLEAYLLLRAESHPLLRPRRVAHPTQARQRGTNLTETVVDEISCCCSPAWLPATNLDTPNEERLAGRRGRPDAVISTCW